MQITHYTTRKRIGFKLPTDAFRALGLIEERRSPLFQDITTLRLNLSRVDSVAGSFMGLSETDSVFVDFDTDHNEDIPALATVVCVIEAHSRAALAIHRFLPGALEYGYRCFSQYAVDGALIEEFGSVPPGRVVHVDENFAVIANARPGSASIHFIRNGKPAWTETADLDAVGHIFWPVLTDSTVDLGAAPVLPTSDLDQVTEWVMSQAYVPALEHDGSFDISDHDLKNMVAHASISYADSDFIVTGYGNNMTAHFNEDGRYGCVLFQGDSAKELSEILKTPGLAVIDPANPVRKFVNEAISTRRHYLATRDQTPPAAAAP